MEDLSRYSAEQLRGLREEVEREIERRRRENITQAQRELKAIAERYGFALSDLLEGMRGADRAD
ncbi:H-NS histone family protein [Halorhodospira halophila]|uniref:H-NS histone family protein n=1 Tax=Halorhodospira halophila (strain DSM 244 / SL1) TaxID=349124 RepID=A1WXY3_HALHL|nr:H-NS histone family protein [Halorhodospira halophila]ABM62545.1 hypothetical protein Hhal_1781 [Halorhodospira halophila SL1]MBK1728223.1 hypothetical protein [Halorhodospira halophila]